MILSFSDTEEVPTREDGERWPHLMVFGDTGYVADTAGEIIEIIDNDYRSDLSDLDALNELNAYCEAQAMNLQKDAVSRAISDRVLDMNDEDLLSLLLADKDVALVGEDGSALTYEGSIPLFVSAGVYETGEDEPLPLPEGEAVRVLNPATETQFLTSLAALGIIRYMRG